MTTDPSPAPVLSPVRWPDRFRPDRAPVHVRNAIDIAAPPARVWAWLVRAPRWPEWYRNSAGVELEGGAGELALGTQFRWRTFGVALLSRVEEFEAPERLAWTGRSFGVDVYHAWLITETASGCHVLTEESQHGLLARLDHRLRPHRMGTLHQVWLEALRGRAMGGSPAEAGSHQR